MALNGAYRNPFNVHHTSMGISLSISEIDHAIATFVSDLLLLLLLLLKLFVAARVIVASPRRTVVAQSYLFGERHASSRATFLHTCGDEADCQVSMSTNKRLGAEL